MPEPSKLQPPAQKEVFSPVGMAAALWLIVSIAAYYLYHKPISPQLAFHFARMGLQVGSAFWLCILAGGLGHFALRSEQIPPLARPALQAAAGFGALGTLYLFFGAWVGVSAWSGWGLLLLLTFFFRKPMHRWVAAGRDAFRSFSTDGWFSRLLLLTLAWIFLLTLLIALAPPLRWDSLNYHLALPLNYLEAGRVIFLPENMFSGMPQVGEMLYTWAASLAGLETAVLLGWTFGVLAIIGLAGLLEPHFGPRAALVGAVSLVSGFTLASMLAWGYVDWLAALYGLAVFTCLEAWSEERRPVDLVFAGLFAGFALGTKYTAGVAIVAGLVLIWFGRGRPPGLPVSRKVRALLVFGLLLTAVTLPWWVKNMATAGNPFHPFLIPTETMPVLRQSFLQDQPPWGGIENALLLPWQAVITGIDDVQGFGASLGPLVLALGALSWLGWRSRDPRRRRLLRNAWVFALAGLAIWAAGGRVSGLLIQSRLFLALFPVFGLLAGAGYDGLENFEWPGVRLGRIAAFGVLLVLGLNIFHLTGNAVYKRVDRAFFSRISDGDYLVHNLGDYALAIDAVNSLPPGSRVKMLWEARSALCQPLCEPDEVLDDWVTAVRGHNHSPAAVLGDWQRQGFTHVLLFRFGSDLIRSDPRYMPEDWSALDDFLGQLSLARNFNDIYHLYELP